MTEYQPSGYSWVVSMVFADLAGNVKYVYFTDSPLDQPIQKVYIETSNPDTEAPEVDLNRITVYAEPTNPENPDGETLVTINYYARDNKSGLGLVGYILRDPQGIAHGNYHYHRNFYTLYFDGNPTIWEKYTISCVLPKGSAPGIWGLAELTVLDKVQNGRTYNFVETLVFEPDDSTSDYVLFAELNKNNIVSLEIESETEDLYGFTYRIINEDTGEELRGEVMKNNTLRSSYTHTVDVDVSGMSDGSLVIIVQIKDEDEKTVAVRTGRLTKSAPTEIRKTIAGDVVVYPNPVRQDLFIQTNLSIQKIEVYSAIGSLVLAQLAYTERIEMANLPAGIYFVKVYTNDKVIVNKIIKE
jgi:hypothetical protein